MTRVFIHPLAGVLSAYGMGLAEVRALREDAVEARLERGARSRLRREKAVRLGRALRAPSCAPGRGARAHRASASTSSTRAPTPRSSVRARRGGRRCAAEFERLYGARFSFLMPERALVVEAVSVEAVGSRTRRSWGTPRARTLRSRGPGPIAARRTCPMVRAARPRRPRLRPRDLAPGDRIAGPAIIAEHNATTVVEPELGGAGHAPRTTSCWSAWSARKSRTRSAPPSIR